MKYFYSVVKVIYFILTIAIGVFFLRGELLFGESYNEIITYIVPWYFLLCGLMIGYVVARIRVVLSDVPDYENKIYIQSFVLWIVLGLAFALAYVFLR